MRLHETTVARQTLLEETHKAQQEQLQMLLEKKRACQRHAQALKVKISVF